jgi:AmpD protein
MSLKNSLHIDNTSWLNPVTRHLSPNRSERPQNAEISLLVIHNISLPPGQFSGSAIIDFFLNQLDTNQHPYFEQLKYLKVSSHLLIRRDGEVIQFVPFSQCAWHAGHSSFQGRARCNDYSIGVELEGSDDDLYTEIQYETLAAVTAALLQHYPLINLEHIVGHSDIAPGRKTDPGPLFDWQKFYHCVKLITGE